VMQEKISIQVYCNNRNVFATPPVCPERPPIFLTDQTGQNNSPLTVPEYPP
jgi:hypothetical protein